MKRFYIYSVLFLIIGTVTVQAEQIDTLKVYSKAMNKLVNVVVVTPQGNGPFPVIYLLHGYGGNEHTWLNIRPDIKKWADRDGVMVVCPNAESSWYWDSPKVPTLKYETFTAIELPTYIDTHYPTRANKGGRAITGLSMGGHGAMWLALRHANLYGAAGSTSGGVDIRPFPHDGVMKDLLGPESENQALWDEHVAINQIERIKNGDLALIIDCGYDDFFLDVNLDFHKKLLKYNIQHDFILRAGAHTSDYWSNSIAYQWLFFKNFFDNN